MTWVHCSMSQNVSQHYDILQSQCYIQYLTHTEMEHHRRTSKTIVYLMLMTDMPKTGLRNKSHKSDTRFWHQFIMLVALAWKIAAKVHSCRSLAQNGAVFFSTSDMTGTGIRFSVPIRDSAKQVLVLFRAGTMSLRSSLRTFFVPEPDHAKHFRYIVSIY